MANRHEHARDELVVPSEFGSHSLNQQSVQRIIDGHRRFYNPDPKAQRAAERRERKEQFLADWPAMQFDRVVRKIKGGLATREDQRYYRENRTIYERPIPLRREASTGEPSLGGEGVLETTAKTRRQMSELGEVLEEIIGPTAEETNGHLSFPASSQMEIVARAENNSRSQEPVKLKTEKKRSSQEREVFTSFHELASALNIR